MKCSVECYIGRLIAVDKIILNVIDFIKWKARQAIEEDAGNRQYNEPGF